MKQVEKHLYEFGPFQLDPVERLLLRDGQHVPLTPKAFEMLLVLVENGGHVIDKDELLRKVWPDTFVEEVNLAKNVSYLRKILGGEQSAQYIETIPRRGYRFVASVKNIGDEPTIVTGNEWAANENHQSHTTSPPLEAERDRRPANRPLNWLAAGLGLLVLVAIGAIAFRPRKEAPAAPLKIVPFTSFPGRETHPTFSPDGNQLAFVWDGEQGDNPDIYVQLIGAGQPLRLTTHPAADSNPVWSPDGRYVAFFRQTTDSSGYYLVPALGGTERKVAEVFPYRNALTGNSRYYAPDGKYLAISDKSAQGEPFSLYLLTLETGEKQKLTAPPPGTVGDTYPAFSPDGKTLAYIHSSSQATTDIYLLPLTGGASRRLTYDHTSILGLAWTSAGREIVFASRRGSSLFNLWRIPASGGKPEHVPTLGQNVVSPTISRQGNRLAYTQSLDDLNIWRLELEAASKSSARLIASTLSDNGPDYAPDGQKIVFASNRTGDFGIWVCERDGGNPVQLVNRGASLTGTPRWSPDGRWIAFDSRSNDSGQGGNADIYVISADGGQPRRLTREPAEDVAPSWSRDGKWIYFGSTRSGSMQVWKVPAAGGAALQVTKQGGFESCEAVDGKLLYYSKGRALPGLWQIPTAGGEEKLLLDHHQVGYWRLWTVAEKGIYFVTAMTPAQPVLEFFSLATGKVTQIATLTKSVSRSDPGLSLSPDGRWLLFAQLDQIGSDIMLTDDFR